MSAPRMYPEELRERPIRVVTDLVEATGGPSINGAVQARSALADGSAASTGDTIITRKNRRDLRPSTTDFVKNGDWWTGWWSFSRYVLPGYRGRTPRAPRTR